VVDLHSIAEAKLSGVARIFSTAKAQFKYLSSPVARPAAHPAQHAA